MHHAMLLPEMLQEHSLRSSMFAWHDAQSSPSSPVLHIAVGVFSVTLPSGRGVHISNSTMLMNHLLSLRLLGSPPWPRGVRYGPLLPMWMSACEVGVEAETECHFSTQGQAGKVYCKKEDEVGEAGQDMKLKWEASMRHRSRLTSAPCLNEREVPKHHAGKMEDIIEEGDFLVSSPFLNSTCWKSGIKYCSPCLVAYVVKTYQGLESAPGLTTTP